MRIARWLLVQVKGVIGGFDQELKISRDVIYVTY
jgi:hypothetical protein